MNNRYFRYIFYAGVFIAVIIMSILTSEYVVNIPFVSPFGMFFFAFLIFGELIGMVWQGSSPRIATPNNHWSINHKDIDYKPWYRQKNGEKTQVGEMAIVGVGGIDYMGVNPHSSSDYPMLIFPSNYLKKIGQCYNADCNFVPFEFSELPPFIRHYLKNRYGKRIKDDTEIYFGATSTCDGTATPDNDKLLEMIRAENKYITKLEDLNEKYLEELKKYDERKAKQYFVKEAGGMNE